MAGVVPELPKFQFKSALGVPLVNGTVTVYLAGTTTLANTWQDVGLTTLNQNPITLDARGEALVYVDPTISYKFVLKNALGATQWTLDNISGASLSTLPFVQAGAAAVTRTAQDKLRESLSVKDFGAVGDGLADDTAEIQACIDYATSLGRPIGVYFPAGRYKVTAPIVVNPALDFNSLVTRISLFGDAGHRAYDSGDDMPASLVASGTFTSVLDLRAVQKFAVVDLGFFAPSTVDAIIRFGAEGISNAAQIPRVGTISGCLLYGSQRTIDGYLTSGLNVKQCNISRGVVNGIRLNACGDYSLTDNFVNNIGPILSGGVGSNYYDGAAILSYGGGGNNRISGGKVEVCSKGILVDNVQGFLISGINFDKCKEFSVGISGNTNTAGKTTNLAYQPRSISVTNCRFVGGGWDATYKAHIYLSNSGTDLEISVTLGNNVHAKAGQDAIDLLMTASGIFGAGPTRCIRCNISGTGNTVYVSSAGNKYQSGAVTNTVECFQAGFTFAGSQSDEIDLPVITTNGLQFGFKRPYYYEFSWTPTAIATGNRLATPTTAAAEAGVGVFDVVDLIPPSSLLGLGHSAYVTSNGNVVGQLLNLTGGSVTPPSGTWAFRVTHR